MNVDYNKLIEYQDEWKRTLPSDRAIELTALSRELMHQAINNNNHLPCKDIFISKGFSDYAIYHVFRVITNQKVLKIQTIGKFTCVTLEKE